jgi:SAM-dependent methyltransferase
MDTINGSIYDFPQYYDLLFGADWKSEYHFLLRCFKRHATRTVNRLFEPACGTGRLLVKFSKAEYEISGNDLNPQAVAFCNARLERMELPARVVVGDMADFRLRRKVDAAFNTINSFRHLAGEEKAVAHLRCMAEAIARGGLYVLGLHLTPLHDQQCTEERWSARKGRVKVDSRMWTDRIDRRRRQEWVRMTFDITTPKKRFRLADEFPFRTYTPAQFRGLLAQVPQFEVAETYDFNYSRPIEVHRQTEDVVWILRRK